MDAIILLTGAAAGLIGWLMCWGNERVNVLWKIFIAVPAIMMLSFYLVTTLPAARLEWWTGVLMDRVTMACCLLPVAAWPIRSPKQVAARQQVRS